jgi:hypothetical protein
MSRDLHPEGSAWPVGGGETAARVRTFDWAATPLGPIERWPQSLKSAVDLVLSSQLAMNLIWGPERVQIYNEANQAFMGTKHPTRSAGRVASTGPKFGMRPRRSTAACSQARR